jgi:aryl-alcohol dehydrogenase-like predicted oxidoreductase
VSTLILGFSKVSYIDENIKSLELYKKWTPEIENKINAILNNTPPPSINSKIIQPNKPRR